MNNDNEIIPIVEDDQGEGFKDVFESYAEAMHEKKIFLGLPNEILKPINRTGKEIRRVIPNVRKR